MPILNLLLFDHYILVFVCQGRKNKVLSVFPQALEIKKEPGWQEKERRAEQGDKKAGK